MVLCEQRKPKCKVTPTTELLENIERKKIVDLRLLILWDLSEMDDSMSSLSSHKDGSELFFRKGIYPSVNRHAYIIR